MPRCPSCHAEHRPEARFCQACGEPLAALAVNGSAPRLLRHRGRASSPNGPIVAANGAVEGTADVLVPDDPDLGGRGWVRPDRAPAESRPAATDAVRRDAEPSVWQDADEEPVGWPSVGTADAITGTVRGFQARQESNQARVTGPQPSAIHVWTFRLVPVDTANNPLSPIQVEMRGPSFSGAIHEGDLVSVPGPWQPGTILHPMRIWNETARAEVRVLSQPRGSATFLVILLLAFLCMGAVTFFGYRWFAEVANRDQIRFWINCEASSGTAACTRSFGPLSRVVDDCARWPLMSTDACMRIVEQERAAARGGR